MNITSPSSFQERILNRLAEIEAENQIKIAFACESGSRAWGFPSENSDFDVRFIYVRPLEWYLSIEPGRDVIEIPIAADLDINGFDLKKALLLLNKTNPPLLEWLGSPIVYLDRYNIANSMRDLVKNYFSSSVYLHHYLHMARGNYREYLQGNTVWVKKYFYVLRPLLAMRWIESGRGLVPTDFNVMVSGLNLPGGVKEAIHRLLDRKKAGNELSMGDRIPVLSDFIREELAHWDNFEIENSPSTVAISDLDSFFRESIVKVWGNDRIG